MSDDVNASLPRLATLCKALASPSRLAVVLALAAAKEMAVGEVAETVGRPQSSVSWELRTLRDAGLVLRRPAGKSRHYRAVMPEPLQDFIRWQID